MHGNLFEREHQGERTLGASQGSLLCPSQHEQTSRQNDVWPHLTLQRLLLAIICFEYSCNNEATRNNISTQTQTFSSLLVHSSFSVQEKLESAAVCCEPAKWGKPFYEVVIAFLKPSLWEKLIWFSTFDNSIMCLVAAVEIQIEFFYAYDFTRSF